METITNYPKFGRLRIFYFIEALLCVLRGIVVILVISLLISKSIHSSDEDRGSRSSKILISTDMVLIMLYYILQAIGFIYLILGYRKMNHNKLRICFRVNIAILFMLVVIEVIDLLEVRGIGVSSVVIPLCGILYRCLLMKIIYDAMKEIKAFPTTVPFSQMRNCEQSV